MKDSQPTILFLTSTNLASNPRCLKEIELAHKYGLRIVVFAFDMPNWTRAVEGKIKRRLNGIDYHSLQTARTPLLPWLINSLAWKSAKYLYRLGWRSTLMSATVTDKRTLSLLKALRREKTACDLIIAHNPGAFYPAWWLSRKTGIPFAIDVEDFHPGEHHDPMLRAAVTQVMKKVLPDAQYISFASPLIRDATLADMDQAVTSNTVVINNVFPAWQFPTSENAEGTPTGKLRLVWFSQHISYKRGLDGILPVLDLFSGELELTLIGNMDEDFNEKVLKKYSFIEAKQPMPQEQLNALLGEYDIGLALESNETDENRRICLTNKIWAYLQAGLHIWATNTPAQIHFAQEFPLHTLVIDLKEPESLAAHIRAALDSLIAIRMQKKSRSMINQTINWEKEQEKLIEQWRILDEQ